MDEFYALLASLPPEELEAMFAPYEQQQSVLDKQMQLASQLRQQDQRPHASMGGAILGGLSNAFGDVAGAMGQQRSLEGQSALGATMQGDATKRIQLQLAEALRKKRAMEAEQQAVDNFSVSPATMLE